MARLSATSGSVRASVMTSGAADRTTCWQKEWLSGVQRVVCHGSGSPTAPGNTCCSADTSVTRATGTSSCRRTRRANRSNAGSERGGSAVLDGSELDTHPPAEQDC